MQEETCPETHSNAPQCSNHVLRKLVTYGAGAGVSAKKTCSTIFRSDHQILLKRDVFQHHAILANSGAVKDEQDRQFFAGAPDGGGRPAFTLYAYISIYVHISSYLVSASFSRILSLSLALPSLSLSFCVFFLPFSFSLPLLILHSPFEDTPPRTWLGSAASRTRRRPSGPWAARLLRSASQKVRANVKTHFVQVQTIFRRSPKACALSCHVD